MCARVHRDCVTAVIVPGATERDSTDDSKRTPGVVKSAAGPETVAGTVGLAERFRGGGRAGSAPSTEAADAAAGQQCQARGRCTGQWTNTKTISTAAAALRSDHPSNHRALGDNRPPYTVTFLIYAPSLRVHDFTSMMTVGCTFGTDC